MRPEIAKYLHDVRDAAVLVEDFTRGKSFAEYETDSMLRAAVEREFITIGEALAQASKLEPDLSQHITAFAQIVGFRNVLVHGYAVVQHQTVWGVVENDLPVLLREVESLLTQQGSP
jgi:uncharacterized protein with HEPN domain